MNDVPREAGFGLEFPAAETDVEAVKRDLIRSMVNGMGRDPAFASNHDWFYALAYFVRSRLIASHIRTVRRYYEHDAKIVYYLSMEFLPGRLLKSSLINQGLVEVCRQALADFQVDLEEMWDFEVEPALGNGGLGRLAACMLDSMAAQHYAGFGYGIRYEYGLFRQSIEGGEQVEHPENWLKNPSPWEFSRPNVHHTISFNGRVTEIRDDAAEAHAEWVDTNDVTAMGYDIPVVGFGNDTVSAVRLWSAKATADFNLMYFNAGNYIQAVREKSETETLSKVLYPSDSTSMGRELRLRQEYFLVSASLQDILARFFKKHASLAMLPDKVAIQLNDTHPALAIPELMRLLVDVYGLAWDAAWDIAVRTCAFTNHTLLPEALETWPLDLFGSILPRHLQIVVEINEKFLSEVRRRHPDDVERVRRMSLIDEGGSRAVRMAHLAVVGSHKVNGVSELHTDIMRRTIFADFDAFFPGRIVNKTNGIAPRRWLNEANPGLAGLISARISDRWIADLDRLAELAPLASDAGFQEDFRAVKRANKERLARNIRTRVGIAVDPASMFDVHIKRIHEYKRQLLNLLQVVTRYNRIRTGRDKGLLPRTVIFAGKAAPGYVMAKSIIRLIVAVANTVNRDPAANGLLKVVFIPNYDVSTAQDIIPAADLSQQISTAGTEAAGTGNMKLALNGALTIATWDGANAEIARAVGDENIFIFGLRVEEVLALRRENRYDPRQLYESDPELKEALDMVRSGAFAPEAPDRFAPIFDSLTAGGDHYLLLADYAAYLACHDRVDAAYRDHREWTRKAILNVAHMGRFSADRMARDYAGEIWGVAPVPS